MGHRKGLRLVLSGHETSYQAYVPLKENERELLLRIAGAGRMVGRDDKPSLGKALALCARVAFHCWAEHTERYQPAFRGPHAALHEAGLHVSDHPDTPLRQMRSFSRTTEGRRYVDHEED